MPAEITMPQLSDTMTEGTVVKWLKKEGDQINAGDIIAEVETDKATMEMESFESGILAVLKVPEGGKVNVGDAIAVLATGKETVEDVKTGSGAGVAKKAAPSAEQSNPTLSAREEESSRGNHQTPSRPASGAPQSATATATKPAGRSNGSEDRVRISPLARRIAAERGVDVSQLQGSGPSGRIVQADVLAFSETRNAPGGAAAGSGVATAAKPKPAPAVLPQRVPSGQKEVVTLTKMRATIAQRLQQSKQNLPHFYTTVDIDMESLAAMRVRLNAALEKEGVRLSLGDFVAKAVATALTLHPTLNSTFNGTDITKHGDVHLGMAVALPEGLIVPVLKNINQMGLKEIRQRSADLADRARAQKLKGDEMTGATFTVSNLGTYGVSEFSAIINPPEVGILAIAAAEKRAVVRNDQLVARTMMTVTLSADHRVVDGAAAADFLRTLKGLLEEPVMMLM